MSDETASSETQDAEAGMPPTDENFAELLEGAYGTEKNLEGTVVPGTVIAIENDVALIDVGLKAEGHVALREFAAPGRAAARAASVAWCNTSWMRATSSVGGPQQ